jgi:hypothetical protein
VELFRRNRFAIIICDVIPGYLVYNIIAVQKQGAVNLNDERKG